MRSGPSLPQHAITPRQVLLFSVATLSFGACSRPALPPAEGAANAAAPPVHRWIEVRAAAGAGQGAPAVVLAAPNAWARVSLPFPGRVVAVLVHHGEHVRAGQPLATAIVPRLIDAAGAYQSALARFTALSERRKAVAQLRSEGLARSEEWAQLEGTWAQAQADVQSAKAVLLAASVPPGAAPGLLDAPGSYALRSPIDGQVVAIRAPLGAQRDSDAEPLFDIGGNQGGVVEARLLAPPTGTAPFIFTGLDGTTAQVSFQSIAGRVDAQDGRRAAWFSLSPDAGIATGLAGQVSTALPPGAHAIPRTALGWRGGPRVLVLKGAEAIETEVSVVQTSASEAIVIGLLEGTRVAAEFTSNSGSLE